MTEKIGYVLYDDGKALLATMQREYFTFCTCIYTVLYLQYVTHILVLDLTVYRRVQGLIAQLPSPTLIM
jgi:hypothetical protein